MEVKSKKEKIKSMVKDLISDMEINVALSNSPEDKRAVRVKDMDKESMEFFKEIYDVYDSAHDILYEGGEIHDKVVFKDAMAFMDKMQPFFLKRFEAKYVAAYEKAKKMDDDLISLLSSKDEQKDDLILECKLAMIVVKVLTDELSRMREDESKVFFKEFYTNDIYKDLKKIVKIKKESERIKEYVTANILFEPVKKDSSQNRLKKDQHSKIGSNVAFGKRA